MCTHRLPQHSDFRTAQSKLRCMCIHRLPQHSDFRTAQSKLRCMCTHRLPQHSDFRTAQSKLRCMCIHRLPQHSDFWRAHGRCSAAQAQAARISGAVPYQQKRALTPFQAHHQQAQPKNGGKAAPCGAVPTRYPALQRRSGACFWHLLCVCCVCVCVCVC